MYVPAAFTVDDRDALFGLIREYSFGLLVSQAEGAPLATHIPFLLDEHAGASGQLLGHVARANPHWKSLAEREALAVFSGPHAYISPRWYETEGTVPTWNYLAVHAYGRCTLVDEAEMAEILTQTVAQYEGTGPSAWSIDPTAEHFRKLARAIVGFRLEISRLEGKWKLGQNHPATLRQRVAAQLAARTDDDSRSIAQLMTAALAEPQAGKSA